MVLPEDNQIDNPSAFTYWPLILLLLIAIIIVIYFGYKYYQKRKQPNTEQPETSPLNPTSADPESQILDHSGPHGTMTTGLTDTPSRIVSEQFNSGECTSGTGPANPVERTICREIKRKFVIGEGTGLFQDIKTKVCPNQILRPTCGWKVKSKNRNWKDSCWQLKKSWKFRTEVWKFLITV